MSESTVAANRPQLILTFAESSRLAAESPENSGFQLRVEDAVRT